MQSSQHNWLQFNTFKATIQGSFSGIITIPTQTFRVLGLTWNSLTFYIHVCNQFGLHPRFVHILQALKLLLICNLLLHVYMWEFQNAHRRAISWALAVELLKRACGGKSFASEQHASFSAYAERKTEPRSSLSLLHNTLSMSFMHYGSDKFGLLGVERPLIMSIGRSFLCSPRSACCLLAQKNLLCLQKDKSVCNALTKNICLFLARFLTMWVLSHAINFMPCPSLLHTHSFFSIQTREAYISESLCRKTCSLSL